MVELSEFQAIQNVIFDPPITRGQLIALVTEVIFNSSEGPVHQEFAYDFDDTSSSPRFGAAALTPNHDIEVVPQLTERSALIGSAAVRSTEWGRGHNEIYVLNPEIVKAQAVVDFAKNLVRQADH